MSATPDPDIRSCLAADEWLPTCSVSGDRTWGWTVGPSFNQPPGSWTGAAAPSAGKPRGADAEAARHAREAGKATAGRRRAGWHRLLARVRRSGG